MKTIFDKVNPKYLECISGTCEHAAHQPNMLLWCVIVILGVTISYTYLKHRREY